jgi:hypothetical protein
VQIIMNANVPTMETGFLGEKLRKVRTETKRK